MKRMRTVFFLCDQEFPVETEKRSLGCAPEKVRSCEGGQRPIPRGAAITVEFRMEPEQ
jgi:hypothetical protein